MVRPAFLCLLGLAVAAFPAGCAITASNALKGLASEDPGDRLDAVVALGAMKEPRAAGPLTDLMAKDSSSLVRASCARALVALGGAEHAEAFVRALDDREALVRLEAVTALGTVDARAASERIASLLGADPDEGVRRECAKALGRLRATDRIPALVSALSDRDSTVRLHAELALGRITCQDLGPHPDDWQRWHAAFLERMNSGP